MLLYVIFVHDVSEITALIIYTDIVSYRYQRISKVMASAVMLVVGLVGLIMVGLEIFRRGGSGQKS